MLNGTLEYSKHMFVGFQVEEIPSAIYKEISESSLFKPAEIKLSGQKVEFSLIDGSPHPLLLTSVKNGGITAPINSQINVIPTKPLIVNCFIKHSSLLISAGAEALKF